MYRKMPTIKIKWTEEENFIKIEKGAFLNINYKHLYFGLRCK